MAETFFRIRKSVELLGKRLQAFGDVGETGHANREFSRSGFHQRSFKTSDIPEIGEFENGVVLFSYRLDSNP